MGIGKKYQVTSNTSLALWTFGLTYHLSYRQLRYHNCFTRVRAPI